MIRFLLLLVVAFGAFAQQAPPTLPLRFANLPACAGPSAAPRPKAEADGSYFLLRVQDPSGAGIEIWCAKEAAGFNYQYRLTGSEGRALRLDRCQLPDGINSAGIEHEGPVAEAALPNGGQWLRTAGRIIKFQHNNWDARRAHHAVYDFRRQAMTIYNATPVQDAAGRWVETFTDVNTMPVSALMRAESTASMGKNLPERTFDPNRVTCLTALADEGHHVTEQEVFAYVGPNQPGKVNVAWPETTPIDKVEFDPIKRELHLKFLPGTRKAIVSLAIPRTMLGLGKELSHVRLDGRFIDSNETTTATHKAIQFTIDEPVREALLKESQGFPFFAVTGIALLGAIIIGLMIGFLFRRKLPAVPED